MKRFQLLTVALCLVVVGGACAKRGTKTKTAKGLETIYFDFDQSYVKSDYQASLKSGAEWLEQHKSKSITIEGHCDERGTSEYNIALGDRRAKATKKYLTQSGVVDSRLSTVSYGEEKPAEGCHDESCWSKNRRAEFKE